MPWRAGAADFPDLSAAGDADRRARGDSGTGACRNRAGLRHRSSVLLRDGADCGLRLSAAAGDRRRIRHGDLFPVRRVASGQGRGGARREPVQAAERHSGRASARALLGDRFAGASQPCRSGACGHPRLAADPGLHWRLACRHRASCRAWRTAADRYSAASRTALCAGASGAVRHHPAGIAGSRHCHRLRPRPVGACHGGAVTGQYRAADQQPRRR